MVNINNHPLRSQGVEQANPEGSEAIGVAARPVHLVEGIEWDLVYAEAEKSSGASDNGIDPEAIASRVTIFCCPPLSHSGSVARSNRILPRRGGAKIVVEVVNRKHMTNALIIILV